MAAPAPQGPCRNFGSQGGCRFGKRCKFSHDLGSTSPLQSPHQNVPSPPTFNTQRTRPARNGNAAPKNVCNFYWNTGQCERGFDCTYKHQKNTKPLCNVANTPGGVEDEEDVPNSALEFFTTDNLTQMAGVGLASAQEGTPENAHNAIKRYLGGGPLNKPSDMKPLTSILASVNRRNRSWTVDKAQVIVICCLSDELSNRIGDILKFPDVSPSAATGLTHLSFQLDYFPVLEYFTSDLVLKSTLHHNINALYAVLYEHWEIVSAIIESSMQSMISNQTWNDLNSGLPGNLQGKLTGAVVFKTLSELVIQVFNRFKTALERYPQLNELVGHLVEWFDVWATGVQSQPPTFQDPVTSDLETCQLTVRTLRETIERLRIIIGREHRATESRRIVSRKIVLSEAEKTQALLMRVEQTYDPPGHLRPDGPRHDNDFANIADIRICPTSEELMCQLDPYLPVTIPGAPHHLPAGSMERHLDIQFRLLREDLTFPIRESLKVLQEDLDNMWTQFYGNKRERTELEKIMEKGGGLYRSSGSRSVIFTVYTGVHYAGLDTGSRGFSIGLTLRCPPGPGRDPDSKKRSDYWQHAGSKRLTSGTLVALVLVSRGSSKAYLANLVSSAEDIAKSSLRSADYIHVNAAFFDPEVEIEALREERITIDTSTFALLIDNGVMFESVRPFLKTLSDIDSSSIPFSRYICAQDTLKDFAVRPPKYATAPKFRFQLQSVAAADHKIDPLDVNNPASVTRARAQLRQFSVLDPSQADSVVDALTREVSLIQGPPGTGKSYTGKELFRILLDNKIKPIVLIAFTNHALDHMLSSILDAKITEKVVRFGSRSSDERIAEHSLWNLEQAFNDAVMNRQIRREYAIKKKAEAAMYSVMDRIQIPEPSEAQIKDYLRRDWVGHLSMMYDPPFWIVEYADRLWGSEDDEGEWKVQGRGRKGKGKEQSHLMSHTYYGLWKRGLDIAFIQPPKPRSQNTQPEGKLTSPSQIEWKTYRNRMSEFFNELGFGDSEIPLAPNGNRPFIQLQDSPAVWAMSLEERQRLAKHWEEGMRRLAYHNHLGKFKDLRKEYDAACEKYEAVADDVRRRRRVLKDIDLIGCTTTGEVILLIYPQSIQPRVLVVEEAGQVLEAHILASLVESVQHIICIGDPKQLRPNLATFSLSVDSGRGRDLFKFDRSLMERLADNSFPMSQINVQRRMRPEISHHIRTILYPKLEDNEIVKHYPDVKGMSKNVVFFTHDHKEDGGQESVSKVNSFEVDLTVDLVMYLLRQGEYNDQGDIAVLCAYLGQLQRVRAALRSLKVTVAIDERDEDQLVKQGLQDEDETPAIEEVAVTKHVRLGTVDNFQGQEAKVVIVSLVRNSGEFNSDNASIGFLKSENRINVALSRAKHGLYIMGNASNLQKNSTWSTILDEMERKEQIGFGFPVACARHPDRAEIISEPGQLPSVAPLGGCLLPCEAKLPCGHICQLLCHADLDNHKSTLCYEKCVRSACIRHHPCVRLCYQPCGDCKFPFSNVTLPCRHVEEQVPCYQLDDLTSFECQRIVEKKLPHCEHSKQVACYQDPASVSCTELCEQQMDCCPKICKGRCGECQSRSLTAEEVPSGPIQRVNHAEHPCERVLYCQHRCGRPCHPKDQGCNNQCKRSCLQRCTHHKCRQPCFTPCDPCLKTCPWSCGHHECPVACGSVCARLPCDEPCAELLECDHPCPSVCGEPCKIQKCVFCMSDDAEETVVDLILRRTISDIDVMSDDVSEKLITLECGHIFTVKTLDDHCSMSEYYDVDPMTGRYLGMKSPPTDYQTPPACPTCRGPITSPRYSRVTKRANLDILEQNVASSMSRLLEGYRPSLEAIATSLQTLETAAKGIGYEDEFASEDDFLQICEKRKTLFGKSNEPLPIKMLRGLEMFHGFPQKEAEQWIKITKEITLVYGAVTRITSMRSAHVKAYEAAMSTLLELEMKAIALDPSEANGQAQHKAAFAAVNAKIGQPPRKADRKYHVEAFILSIELRLVLAQVASARISRLQITSDEPDRSRHRQIWITFVRFLYDSCIKDCAKAVSLARSCSSLRQEVRINIVNLRCTFEKLRFDTLEEHLKIQLLDEDVGEQTWTRERLGDRVAQQEAEARGALLQARARYLQHLPVNSQEEMGKEVTWFEENCTTRAEKILDAYKDLQKQVIGARVSYQFASLQEKQDIVKTFVFGHAGHFDNCENGHTFIITECDGATQAPRCPECRAPVGGSSDLRLSASDTRTAELELFARRYAKDKTEG
ncbi:hypothetical protein BJ322DRAFT_1011491 [Thelephora terrestris]|uniref:NFX1-type zinc finger-containing protein 1 n=1 Tax=Thelephora terrestris TaxID=56493 RepID=A0A9P6HAA1_9AGAM|nr:hypothetical protein BJ322DRAFT_1011491 [Thelephora terrestris]